MLDFGAAREVLSQGRQLHPARCTRPASPRPRCTAATARWAPGPTSTRSAPASTPACRAIRPTTRRSASRRTASRSSLSRLRNVYSDNLIEVTEWCMSLDPLSRPQSVFALQKELARETERRYTKLSFSERLKLQLENLTTSAKALKRLRPARRDRMRFSVYQVSRKGGREKNEDRMGYCYTRERACSRSPTAWAATRKARSPRSSRCRPWRRCSSAMPSRRSTDPLRFLHDAIIAGHHQLLRYATAEGADRHAAHHHRRLPAAGQRGLLGALRRFAAVPGARRQADRPHARPFVFRAAADDEPGRADGRPLQPQRALHLPRQPRQAGGRHRRPAADAAGRPAPAVLRRPVGQRRATATSPISSRSQPVSDSVPELVEQALRNGGAEVRQRHGARGRVGSAPRTDEIDRGISDRQHHRRRRCSPRPSRRACSAPMRPTSSTTPRSSARSREINEAIRRSLHKKS